MTELQAGTAIFIIAIIIILCIGWATIGGMSEECEEWDEEACEHLCTSDCRHQGCNCKCGEYHCEPEGVCRYPGEQCVNHKQNAKDLH